ncbi:transposable element Tc1 transposase [Trichonephila clavipes]|nr:transposable element Tc1 transposase [Trichonephila clavipes]
MGSVVKRLHCLKKMGSERPPGSTEWKDRRKQHTASAAEIQAAPLPFATLVVSSHSSLENGVEICCVFSDESIFCLGASDGRVLVKRKPGKRLQSNCRRLSYTEPTLGLMIFGDNAPSHATAVKQRGLQSFDMLPCPAGLQDMFPIERKCDNSSTVHSKL